MNFALTFTPTAHARTEQMFSDWSNALNNTQHFEKQRKFAVNKCLVLFSEMFSMFDWGLRKSGKRTSYFHDNCVQQCKQYKSYKDKTFLRNLQMHMYLL